MSSFSKSYTGYDMKFNWRMLNWKYFKFFASLSYAKMHISSATTVGIWKHLTLMGILVSYSPLRAYAHCSTQFHCNDSINVANYLATTNGMCQLFASISFHIIRILFFWRECKYNRRITICIKEWRKTASSRSLKCHLRNAFNNFAPYEFVHYICVFH